MALFVKGRLLTENVDAVWYVRENGFACASNGTLITAVRGLKDRCAMCKLMR